MISFSIPRDGRIVPPLTRRLRRRSQNSRASALRYAAHALSPQLPLLPRVMSFFQSLVDQYFGRKPKHFDLIASRLREGKSSLEVRRELTDQFDLSKLQAGKLVQDVERAIKAWRVSLGTGMGAVGLAVFFLPPVSLAFVGLMIFGLAQTVAGMRGMHTYRQAEDPLTEAGRS